MKKEVDYYGLLNLTPNCSFKDVNRAFHSLILQYHPVNCEEYKGIFQLIAEAYDTLRDPVRRAVYDQYGIRGLKEGVKGPDDYIQPYLYHGDAMKTYREFFGTESPYANLLDAIVFPLPTYNIHGLCGYKKKDDTIYRSLPLTLEEIFYGGKKKVKMVRSVISTDKAVKQKEEKILTIHIQPGLPQGIQFSFPEAGDQNPTIIPADVVFVTEDRPHERFRREGLNLVMIANITLLEALTGCTVEVKTLDNRMLRIPITDIIHPQYTKVLEGEGMPFFEDPVNKRGNLEIVFKVEYPKYLPQPSKNIIKQAWKLASQSGGRGQPEQVNKLILQDKMYRIKNSVPNL